MDSFKEQVKSFLKKNKKSRAWLAEQLLVSTSTVNDWFLQRGVIPQAKKARIEMMMREEADSRIEEKTSLIIPLSRKEEKILKEFQRQFPDVRVEDYMRMKFMELAAGLTDKDAIIAAARKYGNLESGDLYAAEDDADE